MKRAVNNRFRALPRFFAYSLVLMLIAGSLAGCAGSEPLDDPKPDAASNTQAESTEESAEDEVGKLAEPVEPVTESGDPAPHPAAWSEVSDLVAGGALLLGVDTKAEYDAEHVSGATSMPVANLDDNSAGWAKDKKVVLTSSAEDVSRSAAGHLARAGYSNITYLKGGYDAWQGTFEGTDARKATVPARAYYIYTTSKNAIVVSGNMSLDQMLKLSAEVAVSMEGLESEFPGIVDVEVVDTNVNANRAYDLVTTYDVPIQTISGQEALILPSWILVDREGRVTTFDGMRMSTPLSAVYGWCVEQEEAK